MEGNGVREGGALCVESDTQELGEEIIPIQRLQRPQFLAWKEDNKHSSPQCIAKLGLTPGKQKGRKSERKSESFGAAQCNSFANVADFNIKSA